MRHYKPDKNCITTLRIVVAFLTLLLIAIIRYFIPAYIIRLTASVSVVGISLLVMLVYLPLYFSTFSYTVTDKDIIRSSGVFIKHHQSAHFSAIQYSTVISTPFSSYTGLNFLILFLYGGQIRLPFLSRSDLNEILELSGCKAREEV